MSLTNSEKGQKVLREHGKATEAQLDVDLSRVMSDVAGRRFIWHILDTVCNIHGGSYTGNSQTFYNEGRRAVGIELMQWAQGVCAPQYLQMMTEQVARLENSKSVKEAAKRLAKEEDDE